MRRVRWVASILAAVVVLVASPARAFVRETTSYGSGVAISWPTACVRLAVGDPASPSLAWQDLLSATAAAANTWNAAAASCGGGFQFVVENAQFSALAPLSDGVNAVLFEPNNYCAGGSSAETCDPLSLSITWREASADGQLHEADVVINGDAYQWGLEGDGAAGTMDLQSALTHELGPAEGGIGWRAVDGSEIYRAVGHRLGRKKPRLFFLRSGSGSYRTKTSAYPAYPPSCRRRS